MSDVAIKIENLSKQYRLGVVGTGTLSHDLKRWWTVNMRGKEDPYLKIGETNDRSTKANSEYVWALKDINLEIKQGDVVGIIGKNGAGKSTLLKILSKVTKPTTGTIQYKGRIASLLEVGTGFHMEMTGRENIYMNGAIMGMTRSEITSKLDEIIDFAGVERFIDTPVKRYSSGMTVRLGFAIAAHLEPEILVVDEVLAVGDAEFQKKAIGKMQDVSKGEGRTVLFVSHNMGAVKSLCDKGVLLKNGFITAHKDVNTVVDLYLNSNGFEKKSKVEYDKDRKGNGKVIFSDFYLEDINFSRIDSILTGHVVYFVFEIKVTENNTQKVDLGFSIHNEIEDPIVVNYSSYQDILFNFDKAGKYTVKFKFSNFNIAPGTKSVRGLINADSTLSDWPERSLGRIHVEMGDFYNTGYTRINERVQFLINGIWQSNNAIV